MRLSVITVTFNSFEKLDSYLLGLNHSLGDQDEVIVVDNNSSDETMSRLRRESVVRLVASKKNLGFGAGCNLAVGQAQGEYLLILNPDTILNKPAVEGLVRFMEDHPEVGLVAPKLVLDNGQIQTSVTKLPTLRGAISEYWCHQKGAFSEYIPVGEGPVEVEAVYGACWLIKRAVFEKLGGFDEKFFMYYEDLDLCQRLKKLGLKIIWLPAVSIRHSVGASAGKVKRTRLGFGWRWLANFIPVKSTGSQYYLMQSANKYFGLGRALLIRLIIYLGVKFSRKP